MSEKRFGMYRNILYDDGDILNPFDAMKLLNYFDKENTKLKEENEQLGIKLKRIEDARKSYKEDWKACSVYCEVYKSEIYDLKDNINGLLEENNELKQENRKLKENLEHCANQFTNDGKNVLLSLKECAKELLKLYY